MKLKPRLWRRHARHFTLLLNLCCLTIILNIFYHYTIITLSNNDRISTKMQILRKNVIKHTNDLINLHNFKYLRNPRICSVMEDMLSIIVVTSSPLRYEFRKAIRKTWGQQNTDFKIVFILGESKDEMTRKLVKLEYKIYGDIAQGNFNDTSRNETYKHIMALKWALFYCPTAKFIVKASDNIVVNLDKLKNVLQNPFWNKNENLIACRLNNDLSVKRSKFHIFYVSKEEYGRKYFPPCCSGLFIIYSPVSAARLVECSRTTPYLYLDNVYVTGILTAKLKINLTNVSDLMLEQRKFNSLIRHGDKNLGNFLFGPLSITPDNIRKLWKFLKYINKTNNTTEGHKKESKIKTSLTLRLLNVTTSKGSELIDYSDFKFLRHTLVCENVPLLAIIIVSSSPYNYYKRQAIRNTWGLDGNFFKLVFLFGETDDVIFEEIIKLEYAKYKDIVQGNFLDTYKNLTYKHVMGLQWATQNCSSAKFVLKIDDDIFVNVEELKVLLRNFSSKVERDLIACKLNSELTVQRNKYSKWFVSKDEYEEDKYLQYCSGSFVAYSQGTALRLVAASKTTRYIYVDDFYVTGLLANKLKINVTNIEHLYMRLTEFNDAVSKGFTDKTFVFGPINSSPQHIESLWKLTKISAEKRKMDDNNRNKTSTKFSETTTISNYQEFPGARKHDKDGRKEKSTELAAAIHHEIPELGNYRKINTKRRKMKPPLVTNITIYPVHIKDETGKDKKRNKTGRIKTENFKTFTEPIEGEQRDRKTIDLIDIYVPIRKRVLATNKRPTSIRKISTSALRRLGQATRNTKFKNKANYLQ